MNFLNIETRSSWPANGGFATSKSVEVIPDNDIGSCNKTYSARDHVGRTIRLSYPWPWCSTDMGRVDGSMGFFWQAQVRTQLAYRHSRTTDWSTNLDQCAAQRGSPPDTCETAQAVRRKISPKRVRLTQHSTTTSS